ncbi:MAG TPA: glycosyltransferase, partial [Chloroflexota bacterium]
GATHFVSSPMGLQNSDRELPLVTFLRNWLLVLRSERVLLISAEIRREVQKIPGVATRMAECDIVGINLAHFSAADDQRAAIRQEFGVPLDSPLVTTIGALHPRKSHDLFIASAAAILQSCPSAYFLIVGDGPMHHQLEAQAKELGICTRVIFAGRRHDVPAILAATDVYVKPGVVEGFIGITVLEAMAARKPVVAFETADVQAAILDGQTGLLVPSRDTGRMAEVILGLLREPRRGAELAQSGAALVATRFSLAEIASRLERLYGELACEEPCAA